ncbi:MAG: 3'(2'),5'-bisphosphate nucleotidase CysQ [Acetobacteraceae bacterium]|nr:3'(2'),5'-bisphosphate nucleotidase CysQ [Acetobacteraceae bacterium]
MADTPAALLPLLSEVARAAGEAILPIWRSGIAGRAKPDGSPLTEADLAAERVILAGLAAACPGLPVVSEESPPEEAAIPDRFLLVDPLDGTKEFLAGSGEFTVNIALVEAHRPVAGVVVAPALGVLWQGAVGAGATRTDRASGRTRPIAVRPRASPPVAVASRSHADAETEAFLAGLGVRERRAIGSSLKFCLVAEGEADVYPRFGPTMEWDTAAGHAVLLAAGGRVETPAGAPLRYGIGVQGWRNGPFIAWGGDLPADG